MRCCVLYYAQWQRTIRAGPQMRFVLGSDWLPGKYPLVQVCHLCYTLFMSNDQAPTNAKDKTNWQRYLPEHLRARALHQDAMQYQEHLQAVLRAVLTYLPQHVTQTRLSALTSPAVSGIFVQATLLFADISGFTAMSERLTQLGREGAEVITGIVNDYFATMLAIIAQHGGDLLKFGGDALLVSFSGDDSAVLGCQAALEMQRAMDRFAAIDTARGAFNLRMTAALGTGRLFLASLGTPDRLEFAVMGPTVEQVARAEDLAQAGEVIIDRATYEAARTAITVSERTTSFYNLVATSVLLTPEKLQSPIPTGHPAMADRLVERLDALTPYLPPEIVERLVAAPGQQTIEGEHRLVTVLFANFYGINDIIKAMGPAHVGELIEILNRHFLAMRDMIRKYGGIVNKVDTYAVGYRIMALFGAPIAHEDDPIRAVHAALEMQEAMATFVNLETCAGCFSLKQRIGVNAGYVFAGTLGSTLRQEYSVMGDEVNLASRLMGIAPEGQVLISQSTAERAAGLFEWREHELVQVKGKSRPVRSYQVQQGKVSQPMWAAARGDFFGRHAELDITQGLVDAALVGQGAVLDVSGDPGVGKSRLVAEASAYARQQGISILRGEAVSYGRNIPYQPWTGILRALLDLPGRNGHSADRRRDQLVSRLEQAGLSDWAPIVGMVLGIDIQETPMTASLDAQLRQQRFFDVVLQLLQDKADRTPMFLILDDMQWADAVSLDLAAYVARNVRTSALLFAIIYRPDLDSPPWCDVEGCHTLHLDELDRETSLALAHSALGGHSLSPTLREWTLERTQGNPLFVEEVARTLIESGAIQLESDENEKPIWTITQDVTDITVPTTLTGLIMSRIDRLEVVNRLLLQVASVIGISFRTPVLVRTYPHPEPQSTLEARLATLTQMVILLFSPPEEYAFRHTLTQEVAYESLPFALRRELHVRVGQEIERSHASDLAEQYGVLAHHFERGQAFDKAFTYLVKAGDRARTEFANEAALDNYHRALDIAAKQHLTLPDVEAQTLNTLEAMGNVYQLIGRYAEAIERFQQAIAHPLCPPRHQGDLLRKIAKAYELQGQYDQALQYLAQGRQVLSESARSRQSAEMVRIYNLSGWVHMRRGAMEQAVEECKQGLALLAELPHDEELVRDKADLHNTLGTIYVEQGNYSLAAKAYRRSTDLRQQTGDLPGLASCYNNLAYSCWGQGDLRGASEYLQRSLEISHEIGNNNALGFVYNNLGAVSYTLGDVEQALDYYHTALSLRQRIGDSYGVAQTYSNMGEALVSQQRYDEARQYLEQSAAVFETIQSENELAEVCWLLAKIDLARKNATSALDLARNARRIAISTGNLERQGIAERTLAQGHAQLGDMVQASKSFEASITLLRKSENQTELAYSHYEYGLLLVEQPGRETQAYAHLQQAADLFTAIGAEKEAAQAHAALP